MIEKPVRTTLKFLQNKKVSRSLDFEYKKSPILKFQKLTAKKNSYEKFIVTLFCHFNGF